MSSGAAISFIDVFPSDTMSIEPVFEYSESILRFLVLFKEIFLFASPVTEPFAAREFTVISAPSEPANMYRLSVVDMLSALIEPFSAFRSAFPALISEIFKPLPYPLRFKSPVAFALTEPPELM